MVPSVAVESASFDCRNFFVWIVEGIPRAVDGYSFDLFLESTVY